MPSLAEVAREKLQALAAGNRLRRLVTTVPEEGMRVRRGGPKLLSFSGNDYLGLSRHPAVKEAAVHAIETYGSGAGASRLVSGDHPLYAQLETNLAEWKGTEAALVFGSGYLANTGILPALAGRGDLILADRLAHACLIDGAQLSGAKLLRFRHNEAGDAARLLSLHRGQYRHCLLVTEGTFSMDGDRAPLAELRTLADETDAWLMVDTAHDLTPSPVHADIAMGTLSKALGAYGGYVCAERSVIDYLAASARTLLFSTALPPATVAAAAAALAVLRADPALAQKPLAKARLFSETLGLPTAQSSIVPLILGDEARALAAAAALMEAGYLVVAIRPPTVPEGTSRLRFAFSAPHRDDDVLALAHSIKSGGWV